MKHLHTSPMALALAVGLSASSASAAVTIDWVTIGDPGNAAQSAANRTHSAPGGDGYGAVDYEYRIARNETTATDYAKFLNAVASTDTYGLYNTGSLIIRSGTNGSYNYTVASGAENMPITYVSWFDAARFANWLHNGQPTGVQNASTTEDGAYTLNGAVNGIITKNVGATVWIPSENEWFKAAYYDPTHISGAGGYWLHANQSNSMPGNTIGVEGAANYGKITIVDPIPPPTSYSSHNYVGIDAEYEIPLEQSWYYDVLSEVGAYGSGSQSYYGIDDMAGNVEEWNDAVNGLSRGLRGGSWSSDTFFSFSSELSSSNRSGSGPSGESSYIGFRLASVPEQSTMVLTVLFGAGCLCRRKR